MGKNIWSWFVVSVWITGVPTLIYCAVTTLVTAGATVDCKWSGHNCQYAFGAVPANIKIDLGDEFYEPPPRPRK